MGFYGNITNTSRTQFQFDRIYPSRVAMDAAAASDGIYAGRYVLVNYEEEGYIDGCPIAYHVMEEGINKFYSAYDPEIPENCLEFIYQDTSTPDSNALQMGEIIRVPADGEHNIANPNAEKDTFWQVSERYQKANDDRYYCVFTQYTDAFAINYADDVAAYGTSRGYDSTVWQKTYQDGVDKYVMIAELNTVVPTFDLEPDAPQMVPLQPHFDASSTNVYYKLHWSPGWGFRVKAANPQLIGPNLDERGNPSNSRQKMSEDTTAYPSDETTVWHSNIYNGPNENRHVVFATDKTLTNNEPAYGQWVDASDNIFANDLSEYQETPAAIYYNKAGFSPEKISYAFVPANITVQDYKAGKYYIKDGLMYKICNDISFDSNITYYSKMEDHIKIAPTGYSGHTYNAHDGGVTRTVQIDTQELSIMLPSIGNMIAACWDLIYGDAEINNSYDRNLDVEWEDARVNQGRNGLRLVTDYDLNNATYKYSTKNVDTIAGAINSTHDLMGMIIMPIDDQEALSQSDKDSLDINRIYYDKTKQKFYRKYKKYSYTEYTDYDYVEAENVTADNYTKGTYYLEDNGDYVVSNADYDSQAQYYVRVIADIENWHEYEPIDVSTFSSFDGSVYCYIDNNNLTNSTMNLNKKDFIRDSKYYSDKIYYLWSDVMAQATAITLADEYRQNTYYYKDLQGNYILDTAESATPGRVYFRFNPANAKTLEDLQDGNGNRLYDNIYMANKYLKEVVLDPEDPKYTPPYIVAIDITADNFNDKVIDGLYLYFDNGSESGYFQIQPNSGTQFDANAVYYYKLPPNYTLATETVMDRNTTYYLLNSAQQTAIGDQIYTKRVDYKPAENITDANYQPGIYYYYDSNDYVLDGSDSYTSGRIYYNRVESYELASNQFYVVDDSASTRLIQYHPNEFYRAIMANPDNPNDTTISAFEPVTGNVDLGYLRGHLDEYYVLKTVADETDLTYIIHDSDYSPSVTNCAFTYALGSVDPQTEAFYYTPNSFHYLTDNGNYGDLILDTYPVKRRSTYYTLSPSMTLTPVADTFFSSYEYYQKIDEDNYTLITTDTIPSGVTTVYQHQPLYVMSDNAGVYQPGAVWNIYTKYIPASVTLGTRTAAQDLVELPDFARNMNTMHGLILKINQMLEIGNEDTRDLRTVQGALNVLNDKILSFGTWQAGQPVVVDNYGRLQSAKITCDNWVTLAVNPHIAEAEVIVRHEYTPIADTTSASDLSTNNAATLTDISPNIDDKGHVVSTETKTYSLPHGYGVLTGDSGSVAAGGTYATMKFEGSDNWIQTEATTESDLKKIKITHEYHAGTDVTDAVNNLATSTSAAFTLVAPIVDDKGHTVAWHYSPINLPNSYAQFTGDTGSSAAADTYDSFKFEGTTWISTAVDGTNQKVVFTHSSPVTENATAVGPVSSQTPNYGQTFNIPAFAIDGTGHVAATGTQTVTIPSLGLTVNNSTGNGNVLTGLSYNDAGAFTGTLSDIAGLTLAGYGEASTRIATSSTLSAGLKALDGAIDTLVNYDSALNGRVEDLEEGSVAIVYGQNAPEPGEEAGTDKTMTAVQMAQNIEALQGADTAIDSRISALEAGTVDIVYGQEEPEPGEETGADKTMSAVEMAQNIETLQSAINTLTTVLNGKMDTPLTYTEYSYEVADPQPVDPDPDPFDPTDLYVEDENHPGEYISATVYDSTITYYVQVPNVHTITIDEIVQRLVALENA